MAPTSLSIVRQEYHTEPGCKNCSQAQGPRLRLGWAGYSRQWDKVVGAVNAKYVASSLFPPLSPLAGWPLMCYLSPRRFHSITLCLFLDLGLASFGLISLGSQHSEPFHPSTEYSQCGRPGLFSGQMLGQPLPNCLCRDQGICIHTGRLLKLTQLASLGCL